MKPNLGITAANLKSVIEMLNNVLADASILYIKTRNFHWNVFGEDFLEFHELFEEQYEILYKGIDEIAERVSTLGGVAIGTSVEFSKNSQLKESPGKLPDSKGMVKQLLTDHETVIKALRQHQEDADKKFGDMGTSDFLVGLMQSHEKMAWKLRQYLR